MVEINNRGDLEHWLVNRPHEDAITIAARAALRVAPCLTTAIDGRVRPNQDPNISIILPAFRALAASWVIAAGTNRLVEIVKSTHGAFVGEDTEDYREMGMRVDVFAAGAAFSAAASATDTAADTAPGAAGVAHVAAEAARDATIAATYTSTIAGANSNAEAIATAAVRAAVARADAWEAVITDATMLDRGQAPEQMAASQLWPGDQPGWAADGWDKLKNHVLQADEGWEVWTGWYEKRLKGRPFNEALEEARVLIGKDLWYQGPKAVNAEIARLIEEYSVDVTLAAMEKSDVVNVTVLVGGLPAKLDASLTSVELRAALADFKFDDIERLMRLVPFSGDVERIADPNLKRDRENKLYALSKGMSELADVLKASGRNVPELLVRALRNYAINAAVGPDHINPGLLWNCGAVLHDARLSEDVLDAMPLLVPEQLERLIDSHLRLMQSYLAGTLARLQRVDEIGTAGNIGIDQVLSAAETAVSAMKTVDWGKLPPPDHKAIATLVDLVDEMRDRLNELQLVRDPDRKRRRERDLRRGVIGTAMMILRYKLRVLELGAVAKTLWPETFDAALDILAAMFPDIDWRFWDG